MKSIQSFQLLTSEFTISMILALYKRIRKSKSVIYLCKNGELCRQEDIPQVVSFVLSLQEQWLLIIVEGEDAEHVKKDFIEKCDYLGLE
ncbi:hypothetical protein [Tuberibacillus sp. Marseille-P3662]|uniref:hypothetical protein n=1 Tax=Tuberibacillus sp. Marseille-P3662 TaxID=1965358 RepID=UPI000A1C9370|nr:hypothetical protein [Tuberibacillus sp. Marseille-P3662]